MQAGLSHQCEQAYRFQGHSFTSCIRAGNNQGTIGPSNLKIQRYGAFTDKRMPAAFEPYFVLLIQFYRKTVKGFGAFGLGKDKT